MSFSTNLNSAAERLLQAYGESCSFSRKVEGAYDPSTGMTGTSTDTTYTGFGAPMSYTEFEKADNSVEMGDLQLLLETGTVPLIGDVCTLNSIDYRVLGVELMRSQGIDIAYKLQLRI